MTYSQINPTKVGGFLLLTTLILVSGCSGLIDSCMKVQTSYYDFFARDSNYECRPSVEIFQEYREQCKCKVRKNLLGITNASICFEGYKEECKEVSADSSQP